MTHWREAQVFSGLGYQPGLQTGEASDSYRGGGWWLWERLRSAPDHPEPQTGPLGSGIYYDTVSLLFLFLPPCDSDISLETLFIEKC